MKRILEYVKKYKLFVIIPTVAMIISIALDMFNPHLIQILIDDVIKKGHYNMLKTIIMAIAGITISRTILGYIREFTFDYLSSRVSIDLKRDLFSHIQSLPFSYFDNMNTGELMSRVDSDIDNIWGTIGFGIGLFVENSIYFITASIILFSINWKLALFTLVTMPIIGFIAYKLEKEIDKSFDAISDHTSVLNTTAQENIAGVRLVKAFAREKHEILKFVKLNNKNYELNIIKTKIWGKYYPVIEFLCNISILVVVTFGGLFVIKDNMTLGELGAFNGYVGMLIFPMRMIGWLTNMIAQSSASAKKIFKIMDIEPEIKDKENPIRLPNVNGNIKFNNVSFKYNNEYILKNINIEVKPGSTVAIMGPTGSGKSSIVNLIGRYYDVDEGSITVDGYNVKDICVKDLRSKMAVVSQDTFLFSDTIKENLLFGKENATMNEIEETCKISCAEEFINSLEDKYETVIGERGLGLSGGQKQRLSIARALIRNADILILDDATSALDMETEYTLLKNLYERTKKSTTFIIAHRISAVKNADKIIFIEDGRIVEEGTHESLLARKGKYYDVYCSQFKDFQDIEKEVV
ncbi:putative ABC transporter ATP-binding protein [Clostridium tepidiprofundi DSM 19306]|uniref:Putative ABC transporter ATP-binding protein n=1 Tax=Clostridium tepidiprofundi DSM 19306 TaxID=1121338 RepID=A0A151B3M1_9CLOT|nr:ABC transporter ATP-binding protein [Clostridium tepidiprofundi]KYH34352.1 putative ABC transporter ATP-binding protein [Clostridium tepidiprofundi DSM 19306]